MNDLIRRQDAIDAIDHYIDEVETIPMGIAFTEGVKDGYCRIRSIIMSLPSAQRWISCSERLPEDGKLVLTTIRGIDFIHLRDDETLEDAIERTQKMLRVSCGFWGEDGWYGADGYPEIVKPIAWMPLPEPYKEETNDNLYMR